MDKVAQTNEVFESKDPRYIKMKKLHEEEQRILRSKEKQNIAAFEKEYPKKFREEFRRQNQEALEFYKRMGYDTFL